MRRVRAAVWFCFALSLCSMLIAPANTDEIADRARTLTKTFENSRRQFVAGDEAERKSNREAASIVKITKEKP
jgi:hypothetical protein